MKDMQSIWKTNYKKTKRIKISKRQNNIKNTQSQYKNELTAEARQARAMSAILVNMMNMPGWYNTRFHFYTESYHINYFTWVDPYGLIRQIMHLFISVFPFLKFFNLVKINTNKILYFIHIITNTLTNRLI